jgi:ABC-type Fe3+ transport system permease subunit
METKNEITEVGGKNKRWWMPEPSTREEWKNLMWMLVIFAMSALMCAVFKLVPGVGESVKELLNNEWMSVVVFILGGGMILLLIVVCISCFIRAATVIWKLQDESKLIDNDRERIKKDKKEIVNSIFMGAMLSLVLVCFFLFINDVYVIESMSIGMIGMFILEVFMDYDSQEKT